MSTAVSVSPEVSYNKAELKGLKKPGLVAMVKRQEAKWPGPDVYDAKATTVNRLRSVLVDPRYGFTKSITPPSQPPSPLLSEPPTSPPAENHQDIPEAPPSTRNVKLLIQDTRNSTKMAQTVPLVVLEQDESGPGEWRASLHDLVSRLQNSNAAITGPVRLLYKDPIDTEYWVPFVKVTEHTTSLEEASIEPALVSIPITCSLEIRVENVDLDSTHSNASASSVASTFDVNNPHAKPLEHARSRFSNKKSSKVKDDDDADTVWLREELKTLPGYQDFRDNQRKVQPNPGLVKSWGFIVNASETYFGTVSRVQGRKKMQQQSISNALRLGSSTLSEAKNAVRVIKKYGPGGTNPATEVIERLNAIDDPPEGAKELYPFLRKWEQDHKD
ncbi:hypothetical protein B0H16DRAFT_1698506 [Mycena metata]|uniref:Uncharacterized protein n=1 Tax=Mycena metata TaxID=1033252 RepID=A0AAD7HPL6_9AGAR|nr:hypothetical protein B0H16DRAFT_1698506 [Mycena metata]